MTCTTMARTVTGNITGMATPKRTIMMAVMAVMAVMARMGRMATGSPSTA